MGKKRIGRKDLKNSIKSLRHRISLLESSEDELREKNRELNRRLRDLGLDENYEYIRQNATQSLEVEIRGIPYGNYVVMNEMNEYLIEEAKERLVLSLARGLIENNMVRFIVKARGESGLFSPFDEFATVGARIDVVPWEKLVRRIDW